MGRKMKARAGCVKLMQVVSRDGRVVNFIRKKGQGEMTKNYLERDVASFRKANLVTYIR
jgi:hypothetical protein